MGSKSTFHPKRYSTIIESVIVMLILFLILFGLLQFFYVGVAQMVTDYTAFCSARSSAVGFSDHLVERYSRVAAIAASGALTQPDDGGIYTQNPINQFFAEEVRIPEYMTGERYLEYEYSDLLSQHTRLSAGSVRSSVLFSDYPLNFPLWGAFSNRKGIDIESETEMTDHAMHYLE